MHITKDWLENQYINLGKSINEISKEYKTCSKTITKKLAEFAIKKRTQSEEAIRRTKKYPNTVPNLGKFKEENTNWKGGTGMKKSIHKRIREIKGVKNICFKCGKKGKTEFSFNHQLGDYTENPNDYIELCHKCHMERDYERVYNNK